MNTIKTPNIKKITATIITLNEEKNIRACIESLSGHVDQIVVLDSGSTDKTVEIASTSGAEVYVHGYLGDGPQKNLAATYSKNEWVFSIDADERFTDSIKHFLAKNTLREGHSYAFKRKNHVCGQFIRYGGGYPDYLVRLYQRQLYQYEHVLEHASVKSKRVIKTDAEIYHLGPETLKDLYSKSLKHSQRGAKGLYQRGETKHLAVLRGIWKFARLYLFKGGFLDAFYGFHYCLAEGLRTFWKYSLLKSYIKTEERTGRKPQMDSIW